MFRMHLTINQELLNRLRQMPDRAQRNLRRRLQTELAPELQQDVDALMQPGPGPVAEPFAFGTAKSKRYFFALVREHPEYTDGTHWLRGGPMAIENAFRVQISDRLRENLVNIKNVQRESTGTKPWPARYVLGPWAVAGHIRTGWPEQADIARQLLREKAIKRIIEMWKESVRDAVKGVG